MRKAAEWIRFGRLFATLELATILTLILLQIWKVQGRSVWMIWLTAILIVGGWVVRKEDFQTLGLIGKWQAFAVGVVFLGKLIVWHFPFFHAYFQVHVTGVGAMAFKASIYFLWATVQLAILIGFFALRLQCITGGRHLLIWLGTGVIFGTLHYPNWKLVLVTLLGGIAASAVFFLIKKKNLYWIALAQDAVAMVILYVLHWNMTVGPRYYWYR